MAKPEALFERKAVQWLKAQGAYVVKLKAGPGVPTAAPDRLFVYGPKWCAIEFKASADAPFRPGQQATLAHLRTMNEFVYVAYPENWEEIKSILIAKFF